MGHLKDIVYFGKHDAYGRNVHMYIEATTLPQHVKFMSPYGHCLSWKTRPRWLMATKKNPSSQVT
jgi:hypothetical protein